jgi:hypothetical protein
MRRQSFNAARAAWRFSLPLAAAEVLKTVLESWRLAAFCYMRAGIARIAWELK